MGVAAKTMGAFLSKMSDKWLCNSQHEDHESSGQCLTISVQLNTAWCGMEHQIRQLQGNDTHLWLCPSRISFLFSWLFLLSHPTSCTIYNTRKRYCSGNCVLAIAQALFPYHLPENDTSRGILKDTFQVGDRTWSCVFYNTEGQLCESLEN